MTTQLLTRKVFLLLAVWLRGADLDAQDAGQRPALPKGSVSVGAGLFRKVVGWGCGVVGLLLWGVVAAPVVQAQGLDFVQVVTNVAVDGLDGAFSVTVSPDGSHVYVAGFSDDALAVFQRDAMTGALTFVEVHKDGENNVDGLFGAASVTVSPDGEHVYVAGRGDDALAFFQRDAVTGALTRVGVYIDGILGVAGLDGAYSVTVSPDGDHVYAAGFDGDALAVFQRDATTGELTWVEALFDGVDGVDGLDGARSVTVSPDGAHVYVAGFFDNSVAVFSRNAGTGALTFVERQQDGLLAEVQSVTVSPDGDHVYATSFSDDAVSVFSRNATTGVLTYVTVRRDGFNGSTVSMGPPR